MHADVTAILFFSSMHACIIMLYSLVRLRKTIYCVIRNRILCKFAKHDLIWKTAQVDDNHLRASADGLIELPLIELPCTLQAHIG